MTYVNITVAEIVKWPYGADNTLWSVRRLRKMKATLFQPFKS